MKIGFWDEWEDSVESITLVTILSFSLLLVFLGIYYNVPTEATRAFGYIIIAVIMFSVASLEWVIQWFSIHGFPALRKARVIGAAWFGNSLGAAAVAAGIGIISFFPLKLIFGAFGIPLSVEVPLSASLSPTDLSNLIYIVIGSALVEEFLFRGVAYWSFRRWFGSGILGIAFSFILTSIAFGLFHQYAYAYFYGLGTPDFNRAITAAIFFSAIAILGNHITKSIAYSVGFHIFNNTLGWLALLSKRG